MPSKYILALIFLTSCAKNIYQIPLEVQDLLQKGVLESENSPAKPYIKLERDKLGYTAYVLSYTSEMKKLKRLIKHSGRRILIHHKMYHLISIEDKELSKLYLKRGEQADFHSIMSSHHGPWVSWVGAEVSDHWLSPRWQPKSDSLQKEE